MAAFISSRPGRFPGRFVSIASVTLLAALAAGSCSKDQDRVTNPGGPPPTLAEAWPNEDGRTWDYRAIVRQFAFPEFVLFTDPASVPPVTFDTVAFVLGTLPSGAMTEDTVTFRLQFGGEATLASGITAQQLGEEVIPGPLPEPGLRWGRDSARPPARSAGGISFGKFLHGGWWHRNSAWIGTHDPTATDTLPIWKFLEADLRPGSNFTFQLVPGLADDVLLRARVVRSLTVQTPQGPVANGIEVHYLVDFGVSEETDNMGLPLGAARHFDCGSVIYAPGVGPVRDDERIGLYIGGSRRDPGLHRLLDLTSTGVAGGSIARGGSDARKR